MTPKRLNEANASQIKQWLYISILDIILETLLILTSVYIVWNRQMNARAKWTVIGAFASRILNIACTILRLVFLTKSLTPASSSYWAARVQSITQLSIAYTVTACVVPFLRPLMQAYDRQDGSPRGSKEPSFILRERSSKGSVSSGGRPTPGILMRLGSASSHARGKGVDEPGFSSANLRDVGRLLEPEKAVLKRTRSAEPAGAVVKTTDWSVRHEDRVSVARAPKAADFV